MADKDTHTIQFCCGTTCDAAANLEYVKRIELEVLDLEERNAHLVNTNLHLSDKVGELQEVRGLLKKAVIALEHDLSFSKGTVDDLIATLKARDRSLRMLRSPTECQFIHPDHMG